MAQLIKQPTLDSGSGHDVTIGETELGVCLGFSLSLSLKINKLKKKKKVGIERYVHYKHDISNEIQTGPNRATNWNKG